MDSNITKTLVDYAVNLKYEDLPAEVVEMAKKMAIQTVAVALCGGNMDFSKSVLGFSEKYSEGKDATVFVSGRKTSLLGAVFANSVLADNIDWEDCSWTGHPSAGLVPAALAVSEMKGRSGKEFIEAIVAGFELYERISMAIQPPKGFPSEAGWGLTSWQIFASAVPAAKLLKLSPEKFEQALGNAAVLMAVPNNLVHKTMSNVYHYQHGFCAQDGVLSAMLAEHGIDGMTGAFDGADGFGKHHLLTAGDDFWYLKELGSRYLILETLLKHWPANVWVQTSLDLIDDFMKEDGLTADNFDQIIVDPPTQMRMMYHPEGFEKIIEAQYSIPYCIAALLTDPNPGPQWFTTERLHDKRLLEVAGKIVPGDSEMQILLDSFQKFRAGTFAHKSITVKFKDGRVKTREITCPKGHPNNMLTMDEIVERFYVQTGSVISKEKADKLLDTLMNIEKLDSLENIGALLAF